MSSQQTKVARKILHNIERSLKASCVMYPDTMREVILDAAQELVNEDGYSWDVALAKACKIYPATRYAALHIYDDSRPITVPGIETMVSMVRDGIYIGPTR